MNRRSHIQGRYLLAVLLAVVAVAQIQAGNVAVVIILALLSGYFLVKARQLTR